MPNEVEQRLREIEGRLVGVSDGPWAILFPRQDYYLIESVAECRHPVRIALVERDPVVLDETWRTHKANGRLMAHSRVDILALLREREEENRKLREAAQVGRRQLEADARLLGDAGLTNAQKLACAAIYAIDAALRGEQP
jgi:hypothetical protein